MHSTCCWILELSPMPRPKGNASITLMGTSKGGGKKKHWQVGVFQRVKPFQCMKKWVNFMYQCWPQKHVPCLRWFHEATSKEAMASQRCKKFAIIGLTIASGYPKPRLIQKNKLLMLLLHWVSFKLVSLHQPNRKHLSVRLRTPRWLTSRSGNTYAKAAINRVGKLSSLMGRIKTMVTANQTGPTRVYIHSKSLRFLCLMFFLWCFKKSMCIPVPLLVPLWQACQILLLLAL